MKKNLLLLFLIIISLKSYCQTETVKDSLTIFNRESKLKNEQLNNYLQSDQPININTKISTEIPIYQPIVKDNQVALDLEFPPPVYYNGPIYEDNPVNPHNPYVHDYGYYAFYGLSDNAFMTTSSVRQTYPALGSMVSVGAQFGYQPTSWLIMSGGPYASKYNVNGMPYNDMGANASLKFILHDRIRVNTFGQYSVYGKSNRIGVPTSGMYPQSYYGGGLEFKITDSFGIESGIIRELNPMTGKWTNRPYVTPVFYNNKKKKVSVSTSLEAW